MFIPTSSTVTATEVKQLLFQHIYKWIGVPISLVSDRDPKFVSKFWRQMCAALGIRLLMSSSAHPQTDGQSERSIQTLEAMLRHYVGPLQDNWVQHLDALQYAYNSAPHRVTGVAPFQAAFGFTPRRFQLSQDVLNAPSFSSAAAVAFASQQQTLHDLAADAIAVHQVRTATTIDRRHRDVRFKVGDKVWIALATARHLPLRTLPGLVNKLEGRFFGPVSILQVLPGLRSYKVDLPPRLRIHPVIDVEKLRRFVPSDATLFPGRELPDHRPLPIIDPTTGESLYEVDKIVGRRIHRGKRQYLVTWKGYPADEATWEPLQNLATSAREALLDFDPLAFSMLSLVPTANILPYHRT
jgi:hypothetical protein